MAGALGIRLAGARAYRGKILDAPSLNASGREAAPPDILQALTLYGRALWLLFGCVVLLAAALWIGDQVQDVAHHA